MTHFVPSNTLNENSSKLLVNRILRYATAAFRFPTTAVPVRYRLILVAERKRFTKNAPETFRKIHTELTTCP